MGLVARFNNSVAVAITSGVGTMWCTYAFACLALVSLPSAIHSGTFALVSWVSQTFLQLTLLPLIIVGNRVMNQRFEDMARADHRMLIKELATIREVHAGLARLGLLEGDGVTGD